MHLRRKSHYLFTACLTVIILSSCSSGKKGGQSYFGKVYHNTSAHYNGYYYANLKMTETEQQMRLGKKDDYTKLLPIYDIGNTDDPAAGSEMDSVIKRLTIVVKLHPKSKWADDCYFNIGKAYFYKKDYEAALSTFQFVSSEFKDKAPTTPSSSSSATKKKRKGKPMTKAQRDAQRAKEEAKASSDKEGGALDFLKHKPIRNIDLLWMIRCYANLRKFSDANAIIAYLEEGNKFPNELAEELALTKAYVVIQQKQYDKAIDPMAKAAELTTNKKDQTRYTYILAQLHQLNGDYMMAIKKFGEIASLRPSYEMEFNARINAGKIFVLSGTGSYKDVMSQLVEMSRDDRYEDYYDQIYYYMALVNLRQDKEEEAISNLESSIKKSFRDANQKGLSFLKLGELSFLDDDYLTAQPNYDSAVAFLDPKFDTLPRVKEINKLLDRMVEDMRIIFVQDSLQKLAKMSEKERNKIIDNVITAAERQKQYAAKDTMLSLETQKIQELPGNQAGTSGNWYFYNTSMKATGYNDFIKKWGNRPPEDNWRRSNKKSNDVQLADNNEPSPDGAKQGDLTGQTSESDRARKAMIDNIPLTDEKMAVSNGIIFDAYYDLSTIYKSDLNNIPKAIEIFEKMAARFPENENIYSVYYNLYLLYNQTGNVAKAETYKQLILQNPSSVFAMVITDPDYLNKKEAKKHELSNYYASTYDYYIHENYKDVMKRIRAADSLFRPNPLQAKFELLEAMVTGKTLGRQQYISALDSIVKKYPAGEVHDKAIEILTALGVQQTVVPASKQINPMNKSSQSTKTAPYQMHPDNPHYLVIVFPTISPKTKDVSNGLVDLNKAKHSLDNYKVTPQLLDTKTQMIVVKQMKNRTAAMVYYNEVADSETLFESVEDLGYTIFVIDDKNFPLFYQRKDVSEYADFFSRNYENEEEEEEGE